MKPISVLIRSSVVFLMSVYAFVLQGASFSGGEGTFDNPYLISDVADMQALADSVDAGESFKDIFFKMNADINFSAQSPFHIGGVDSLFDGNFDGNRRLISNMGIDSDGVTGGLFGATGTSAVIANVRLDFCAANGSGSVGMLVGINRGMVQSIMVSNGTVGAADIPCNLGGIVGWNLGTMERVSFSYGSVGYGNVVGGVAGLNDGIVRTAYASVLLSGSGDVEDVVGGVVGKNTGSVTYSVYETPVDVDRCVTAPSATAGGFAGMNTGSILNSMVRGDGPVVIGYLTGGFVGQNLGQITNCGSEVTAKTSSGFAGGFAGENAGNSTFTGRITYCIAVGGAPVTVNDGVAGAFIGSNTSSTGHNYVTRCGIPASGYGYGPAASERNVAEMSTEAIARELNRKGGDWGIDSKRNGKPTPVGVDDVIRAPDGPSFDEMIFNKGYVVSVLPSYFRLHEFASKKLVATYTDPWKPKRISVALSLKNNQFTVKKAIMLLNKKTLQKALNATDEFQYTRDIFIADSVAQEIQKAAVKVDVLAKTGKKKTDLSPDTHTMYALPPVIDTVVMRSVPAGKKTDHYFIVRAYHAGTKPKGAVEYEGCKIKDNEWDIDQDNLTFIPSKKYAKLPDTVQNAIVALEEELDAFGSVSVFKGRGDSDDAMDFARLDFVLYSGTAIGTLTVIDNPLVGE